VSNGSGIRTGGFRWAALGFGTGFLFIFTFL
jgi:hypothetical protein